MKTAQEVGELALRVGDDQVLMGGHERYGVHEHIILTSADRECVEIELTDSRVGAKEVMPAKGASSDHDGCARYNKPRLGHAAEEEQEARHLARL